MKPAKIARLLNIDQKTVTNWTDHPALRRFFSLDALSEDKPRQREYNEADVLVLNTIRNERARNTPWEEIAITLANGYLDRNLPASSLLVDAGVPVVQYERFLALTNERDTALKEVERLLQEGKIKDALLETLRKDMRDLNREIGRLEGRLEALTDQDD